MEAVMEVKERSVATAPRDASSGKAPSSRLAKVFDRAMGPTVGLTNAEQIQ